MFENVEQEIDEWLIKHKQERKRFAETNKEFFKLN